MFQRRLLTASAVAALLTPMAAAAAFAAPPSNDVPGGATVVASLPDTFTEDTTEATTDALDASINENCGAPATNGSVWYSVTDTDGDGIFVDVTASDYSAGIMILDGDPTAGGNLVACGPGVSAARGAAGTTYYVMAFSDTPGVTGGNLSISLAEAPPAPEASLTVNPRATAYKDGSMRISGTYSCTNADGFSSDIEGSVTQVVGRQKINGFFFAYPLECDGSTHNWEAIVVSDTGLFAGGKAANVSVEFACGLLDCAVTEVQQTLQVSRGR